MRPADLFLAAALLVANASAQSSDWSTVQSLPSGTKLTVELSHRQFGHCFVDEISDRRLECTFGRWPLSRRRAFPRDQIRAIFIARNTAAVGAVVGAGTGAVFGAASNKCCRTTYALLGAGGLGIFGWFVGTAADPFVRGRLIYRGPADPGSNEPPLPNRQDATLPPAKNTAPCLRDGVTQQCVP
jgi:hypothetical protein